MSEDWRCYIYIFTEYKKAAFLLQVIFLRDKNASDSELSKKYPSSNSAIFLSYPVY